MVSPEKFKLTGEFPRKLVVALDKRAVELGVSRNAMMIILTSAAWVFGIGALLTLFIATLGSWALYDRYSTPNPPITRYRKPLLIVSIVVVIALVSIIRYTDTRSDAPCVRWDTAVIKGVPYRWCAEYAQKGEPQ